MGCHIFLMMSCFLLQICLESFCIYFGENYFRNDKLTNDNNLNNGINVCHISFIFIVFIYHKHMCIV